MPAPPQDPASPPSASDWTLDAPHPDDLQTGDLLFPRSASGQALAPTVALIDPADAAHRDLLLRILRSSFGDIATQWLHMSVDQLVWHPLLRLLADALNRNPADAFFVGHCAMVLRETAGWHDDQGALFVIEANATDFSHYRVSIHPYHAPADPPAGRDVTSNCMSGWANYRTALGHKVWAARPVCLDTADAAGRTDARNRIIAAAKGQLGRPYGIFDSPAPGDADRLYCSELVLASFRQASTPAFDLTVDDCGSWRWLIEHLGDTPFSRELVADLRAEATSVDGRTLYDRVISERFFLLTVQMLWHSAGLRRLFCPRGEGDYA